MATLHTSAGKASLPYRPSGWIASEIWQVITNIYERDIYLAMLANSDRKTGLVINISQSSMARRTGISIAQVKRALKQLEKDQRIKQVHRFSPGGNRSTSRYLIADLNDILLQKLNVSNEHEAVSMGYQPEKNWYLPDTGGGICRTQSILALIQNLPLANHVFGQPWFFHYAERNLNFEPLDFITCVDAFLSVRWRGRCALQYISEGTARSMADWHRKLRHNGESADGIITAWKTLSAWLADGGKDRPATMVKLWQGIEHHVQMSQAWKMEKEDRENGSVIHFPAEM
jgi:DNA-binding Lrp family transcriptional regulator